jgi:hypothetical protein
MNSGSCPSSTPRPASPKPFFGFSDNTNLHLFLWNLGLVSYHGGAVMIQFGRPVSRHPGSRQSLERALFTSGTYRLEEPDRYSDQEGDWGDPATFQNEPPAFAAEGWSWHGPQTTVTGAAWGGTRSRSMSSRAAARSPSTADAATSTWPIEPRPSLRHPRQDVSRSMTIRHFCGRETSLSVMVRAGIRVTCGAIFVNRLRTPPVFLPF